ncbi:MAG: hypothetical protein A3K23_05455 [Desulfobacca sp. RBG_16_58_9]|nr:MAG: hypothetical protein A3K23_05455 [Desulfobacca sp. RBG_16_58_9]
MNEKELSPELCREYGEKFLALGWWEDALEFFQKGNHQEGREKIKALCLESGDAYLLGRIVKDRDPNLWRRVADRALELGKLQFARRALEMAGDKEKAAALGSQPAGETTLH